MRRVSPQLALKLRVRINKLNAGADAAMGGMGRRPGARKQLLVLGFPRVFVVGAFAVVSGVMLYRTRALVTVCWAMFWGLGTTLAHASFRQQNFKARLANAREEFRAVWRGFNSDLPDHTL